MKLNETGTKVLEAKCLCGYDGLLWCEHVGHGIFHSFIIIHFIITFLILCLILFVIICELVLEETGNTVLNYLKLKEAVIGIPHLTLVHQIICLFSNNNISVESGINFLGKELVQDWLARVENINRLPFLDNINGVLESLYPH